MLTPLSSTSLAIPSSPPTTRTTTTLSSLPSRLAQSQPQTSFVKPKLLVKEKGKKLGAQEGNRPTLRPAHRGKWCSTMSLVLMWWRGIVAIKLMRNKMVLMVLIRDGCGWARRRVGREVGGGGVWNGVGQHRRKPHEGESQR
ncbi:hypothetical protein L484_002086 [Morus notabilis]|uniref:Uncharacterized protein n=1 Tax=Morus notabilis TaxID=981085 RepID=W9SIS0_9ROSA|nr:hypothetical protein L484_002086 [Morus notabilis]